MTSAPHLRLTVAGVAATMLTSLSLSPLVSGQGWLVVAWVVVAVVAATGASMRQLLSWWPAVVAAQAVMLALILTVLFARTVAVAGLLPGPGAVRVLQDLFTEGMDVSRLQAPPVQPTHGILLLTAGGIGLVGLAVDILAVSLRRPALAGLPLLAVYCLPAALLPHGLPWPYFVLAGLGYIVLVAADSGDRVRGWGRILSARSRQGTLSAGPGPEGLGRSGRRVAATCLVVAAVLPALVPGLGGRLFGATGNGNGDSPGGRVVRVVNPILDLRQDLNSPSNDVVIRYTSTQSSQVLLRIVTDSVFDGRIWSPITGTVPGNHLVQEGLSGVPGLSGSVAVGTVRTRVSVGALAQTYLPLPYPARQVAIDGYWLYDSTTLNVVAGDRNTTTEGANYTVDHLDVTPTVAQLRVAGEPDADVARENLKLPKVPDSIVQLARQVGGTGSHYDQAVNLQAFLRTNGGFSYSTKAPRGDNPADDGSVGSLVTFLRQRSGYCVHFASAMALMARILGIPARVAVGFLAGQAESDGSYTVRLRDAHAWPELYFQGVGWVRFEPTPATRATTVPDYTVPLPVTTAPASPTAGGSATPTSSARAPKDLPGTDGATPSSGLLSRMLAAVPWRFVAAIAVLLVVAACPMLAAAFTRRRWRRGDRSRIRRAEGAWEELRQRLSDLGARWAPAWTPRALQARLIQDYRLGGTERAALGRLVSDLESARYERPTGEDGRPPQEMVADVRTVANGVAAGVPASIRRRARWLPSSGVEALLGMIRRVDLAADDVGRRVNNLGSRHKVDAGSESHRD